MQNKFSVNQHQSAGIAKIIIKQHKLIWVERYYSTWKLTKICNITHHSSGIIIIISQSWSSPNNTYYYYTTYSGITMKILLFNVNGISNNTHCNNARKTLQQDKTLRYFHGSGRTKIKMSRRRPPGRYDQWHHQTPPDGRQPLKVADLSAGNVFMAAINYTVTLN